MAHFLKNKRNKILTRKEKRKKLRKDKKRRKHEHQAGPTESLKKFKRKIPKFTKTKRFEMKSKDENLNFKNKSTPGKKKRKESSIIPALDEINDFVDSILTTDEKNKYLLSKSLEKMNKTGKKNNSDIYGNSGPIQNDSDTSVLKNVSKREDLKVTNEKKQVNNDEEKKIDKYIPKFRQKEIFNPSLETNTKIVYTEVTKQLNRLCNQNVEKISSSIVKLYGDYSSNDVNTATMDCVEKILYWETDLSDAMVSCCAALLVTIDAMNQNLNSGVFFLEMITRKFCEFCKQKRLLETRKLALLLGALYSFELAHGKLIKDILFLLIKNTTEFSLSILNPLLTTWGPSLRKNDAFLFGEFFSEFKKHKEKIFANGAQQPKRFSFLCEFLSDLKNNRNLKEKEDNAILRASVQRIFSSVYSGKYRKVYPIGLEDILNENKKGGWWIDLSVDNKNTKNVMEQFENKIIGNVSENLRKQLKEVSESLGFNTFEKQTIFIAISSANNTSTALKRLTKLHDNDSRTCIYKNCSNFDNKLERDISEILFKCAQRERKYNPFYSLIFNSLIGLKKSFGFSLKLLFWDFLKDNKRNFKNKTIEILNVAKLMSDIIKESSLNFEKILPKSVDWDDLESFNENFFTIFFSELIKRDSHGQRKLGDKLKRFLDRKEEEIKKLSGFTDEEYFDKISLLMDYD